MTTVLLKAHCQQWVQTTLPCLQLLERGGSLLGRARSSVSEAPSNLYLLARKYKGYDSNCSSCSTCEVHTPPTPPFQWALKDKDDFLMPAPVSPSLRALSGTKQNSLPGVNDSSFGSLQPMADSNWCINAPVHPPSGELGLGHGSYTISQIQLQSLTAIVGFIDLFFIFIIYFFLLVWGLIWSSFPGFLLCKVILLIFDIFYVYRHLWI